MGLAWEWSGSRWWRCDLHVHSYGSDDFPGREGITADDWVSAAIEAGLDAVAVTDHNTGTAVGEIQKAAGQVARPLAVFPGGELNVTPGLHLLVLFDPKHDGDAVTALLGRCNVPHEEMGKRDALIGCSASDVMKWAAERGGLTVAAHVHDERGILKVIQPGQALQQLLTSDNLHAAEVNDGDASLLSYLDNEVQGYVRSLGKLPRLASSDAHSLEAIGRRFTWIKMTRPDLEGLRLAFQDGPLSVLRADETSVDPNTHAPLAIEEIEIRGAKCVGRPKPFRVRLNPWLNAIIGGRGTGKSSVVEFLRIALRREAELPPKLAAEFAEFRKIPAGRDDRGLLTPETQVRVIYRKDGARFRIQWDQAGTLSAIEQERDDGCWEHVEGEVRRRFPLRIYSQKQIYELAVGPEALLGIVDEAPAVNRVAWDEAWTLEQSRFLALRAKAREVTAGLAEEGRLKGELDDCRRRLAVFEAAGHAEVLRDYQMRRRQERGLEEWQGSFSDTGKRLREAAEEMVPDSLDAELFGGASNADGELLRASGAVNERLAGLKERVLSLATEADGVLAGWTTEVARSAWAQERDRAGTAYEALVGRLQAEGAGDPSEYGRLVQECHGLEQKLAGIEGKRKTLLSVEEQARESLSRLRELRRELTARRAVFLQGVVGTSPHVRIEVIPYGDSNAVVAEFRSLIQKDGPTFQNDLWAEDGQSGVLAELYRDYPGAVSPAQFETRLEELKTSLATVGRGETGGRTIKGAWFAKHLAALKPEAFDRIACWIPGDALKVIYSPRADGTGFRSIEQGSPGQKTAAILAFLLAYGEEPMVLDQPEDDLDNHLIYELIVRQLRDSKRTRQLVVVTHNPNIVVNGDAELVMALEVRNGQTAMCVQGGLQEQAVREEICRVMEGGREAFELRYRRIGTGGGV